MNPYVPFVRSQLSVVGVCLSALLACHTVLGQQPTSKASVAAPIGLTCEYLVDPLGVDVAQPRLGWKLPPDLHAAPGPRQAGYEVLVASSRRKLHRDEGDLWSSGKRDGAQSTLVAYEGQPLESGAECFWKVRVWDDAGSVSDWSPIARWSVGLLSADDWQAEWIGPPESQRIEPTDADRSPVWDPWLRKAFELPWRPERAELCVASIGYHELYVNGQQVTAQVLAPAVSNHRVRARYVTYDIAAHLRPGKNVVALWLGASWAIYPHYRTPSSPGVPVVIAQGEFKRGGASFQLRTDKSWLTHPSPNRLLGRWEFRHFGGEHYDARRELPGWSETAFDDSEWQASAVYRPDVELSAQMVEPNIVSETFEAASVHETEPGVYQVDFGRNFAGMIEVDLAAQPGKAVRLLSSELPEREEMFGLHSEYIADQRGRGTFRSRFNYHSGRYLTIHGAARRPLTSEVRAMPVRTGFARTGRFACSNERLNRIYDASMWTLENLSLGGYLVDCPQRERMGYGGDAHATLLATLYNYGAGAFYTKWAEDWRDCQYDDGYLPNTAPTYWGGGGPGWGGFTVTLPWQLYRQHGDRRILQQQRPTIERWLAFMDSTSQDNLLTPWKGRDTAPQDEWVFLGDWLWPDAHGTNSHTDETLFFNNCYWVYNLQTAAQVMSVLGDQSAAEGYRRRADEVRAAINNRFYDPDQHSYVNGQQAYLALALLADVPYADERDGVWQTLEREIVERQGGHIDAGITGGAMLFNLLMDAGRNDLIYAMVDRSDYPSWGHMLEQGATTIWESWERRADSGHSMLHSSYLYVGAWPLHGLVGISPGPEPGFAEFEIRPSKVLFDKLDWVTASYESEHGAIEFASKRTDDGHELSILVPPNTQARLVLPVGLHAYTPSGAVIKDGHAESDDAHDARTVNLAAPGRRSIIVRSAY
ncbi:Bacterial alpha-L-rhamnosidase [Posidoniimonas corsicana]|uniref:alpha-L-rhamnosidase n=1 Tax=Posidoniimonas corsicana TaxID=1938618 RepID=A0A5C5UUR0_9BACT|nr:family 78 glycoside hydrolase catalytic domain [Posidoniimonas corsicana]TWT29367.1 Bacterial alpha-L-rhamnosidase [Posidoniimonas corsicana]